jgi:mevalonate kinase
MKLRIEKKADGNFDFELTTASDKKPLKVTIERENLETLVKILQTAQQKPLKVTIERENLETLVKILQTAQQASALKFTLEL